MIKQNCGHSRQLWYAR